MNEKTLQALYESRPFPYHLAEWTPAEWTPARNIDISRFEAAYKAESLPLYERTKKFLRCYGGLAIRYHNEQFNRGESIYFLDDAAEGWGESRFWQTPILNPIGDCWHDAELLMDRYGRVWLSEIHRGPNLFAASGEKAIDLIINWNNKDTITFLERVGNS